VSSGHDATTEDQGQWETQRSPKHATTRGHQGQWGEQMSTRQSFSLLKNENEDETDFQKTEFGYDSSWVSEMNDDDDERNSVDMCQRNDISSASHGAHTAAESCHPYRPMSQRQHESTGKAEQKMRNGDK